MKVGILAGGFGSRLAEETETIPKPMVEIGSRPILWHIMKHYSHYGFNHFSIALGYRGDYIKRYMYDYCSLRGDITLSLADGGIAMREAWGEERETWTVDLVETGLNSGTGGRIKRLAPFLGDETFMLTFGDGVSDVNINDLLAFHRSHGKLVTVTAVRPPARFGKLDISGLNQVVKFAEKPQLEEGWINGGFFVMEPEVYEYIDGDETMLEGAPLERLVEDRQLMAYRHDSFWQCMDTLRDKRYLEKLWQAGDAPWKTWA